METKRPESLKMWFIIHFIADVAFAIPLMVIPEIFLTSLGWTTVDPISARLVAAALFGIGIESFIGRNASIDSFISMLNLKIIWSLTAVIAVGVSLIQGAQNGAPMAWGIFGVFLIFHFLWLYWRITLQKLRKQSQ